MDKRTYFMFAKIKYMFMLGRQAGNWSSVNANGSWEGRVNPFMSHTAHHRDLLLDVEGSLPLTSHCQKLLSQVKTSYGYWL